MELLVSKLFSRFRVINVYGYFRSICYSIPVVTSSICKGPGASCAHCAVCCFGSILLSNRTGFTIISTLNIRKSILQSDQNVLGIHERCKSQRFQTSIIVQSPRYSGSNIEVDLILPSPRHTRCSTSGMSTIHNSSDGYLPLTALVPSTE
jgi:hypothetical protein